MENKLIDSDKVAQWVHEQEAGGWKVSPYTFTLALKDGLFTPDPIPLPTIKLGDKVKYLGQEFSHIDTAIVDHLRVHSFGTFADIKHKGNYYVVPIRSLGVSHD